MLNETKEHQRLAENKKQFVPPWRLWGPYVSERAWGTVREDYSPDGNAWDYFPHDHARSRAYRWGEDGLAGICDRYQLLVFSPAFWNGRDPILKERAFGLVPSEANHGEDVKEYYFYLDNVPSHSYMKYLYKYPQAEYPYVRLIEENRQRQGREPEFELLDTGIFDEDRYFDIFIEYAKAAFDDICIRFEIWNRGPDDAVLHLLPQLWFRNTWAWTDPPRAKPCIRESRSGRDFVAIEADSTGEDVLLNLPFAYSLPRYYLYGEGSPDLLFADNETHAERIWGPDAASRSKFVKDAFHRHVIQGEPCVNPEGFGTKAALHYKNISIPGRRCVTFRLRLTSKALQDPISDLDAIVKARKTEADEFYAAVHPPKATEDEKRIQRQALSGMLWSKQIYIFDVNVWMDGDNPNSPPPASRRSIRNQHWGHLNSMRIMSVPDKWEYPWFAAWDHAFHAIPLALVDPEYAKEQLWLLLFEQFQHPNGQLPAYEWEFSDLNPPVHAWACWRVYKTERLQTGEGDRPWLEKCFHKLLINFASWVNKVDSQGNNIFEGGFLGLDNITVVDRSVRLPPGVVLEQSDATGWMAMFCLDLMRIALELARENPSYEALATKFFQHYVYVAAAMKHMGGRDYSLWDKKDGFFYDVLRYPDGSFHKFRVRSLVGLIPLYAIERLQSEWIEPFKEFRSNMDWFLRNRQDLVQRCCYVVEDSKGQQVHVLATVDQNQLRQFLTRVWDCSEFLSPYGIRSLSRIHETQPFKFDNLELRYEPAESDGKIKGGNSNWRGPVWFPTNFLMIQSLRKLGEALGPDFKIAATDSSDSTEQRLLSATEDKNLPQESRECPLLEIAEELANRMICLFTRDKNGRRPIFGNSRKFQEDPHWKDYLQFYEYFHGDTGMGLGASHQTGWTGLVASLIDEWRR